MACGGPRARVGTNSGAVQPPSCSYSPLRPNAVATWSASSGVGARAGDTLACERSISQQPGRSNCTSVVSAWSLSGPQQQVARRSPLIEHRYSMDCGLAHRTAIRTAESRAVSRARILARLRHAGGARKGLRKWTALARTEVRRRPASGVLEAVLRYGATIMAMNEVRTIGMLAADAEVNVETIRYYHRRGLLRQPRRPPGRPRHYDDEALRVVLFIKQAQGLGFSLDEIEELLSLRVSTSSAVCTRVRAKATKKLGEIDDKIAALRRMRAILAELTSVCPGEGPAERCSILRALDSGLS